MANKYIRDLSLNASPDVGDSIEIDDGTNSEYVQMPAVSRWLPQGTLVNGRLSVTVSSNDLIVALKGLDGNNPSSTNPVYVRIGNTFRAVTAALSVTAADATNWFNAGSAELATNEIDYFAYLGYNATDGVVIGFARIPHARVYGDFSTTSTAETYCKISTITNAASTDEYEVIGRFNATLSAGAGYTWSIPATAIVINRPIYETRWLDWAPTYSGSASLTYTSVSTTYARYKIVRKSLECLIFATGTTGGTASTQLQASLPFGCIDNNSYALTCAIRDATSGVSVVGTGAANGATSVILARKTDSTNYGLGTGRIMQLSGFYPIG